MKSSKTIGFHTTDLDKKYGTGLGSKDFKGFFLRLCRLFLANLYPSHDPRNDNKPMSYKIDIRGSDDSTKKETFFKSFQEPCKANFIEKIKEI